MENLSLLYTERKTAARIKHKKGSPGAHYRCETAQAVLQKLWETEVPCMNRLECQVTSCQHNQHSQCCLAGIQVDGPSAQEPSQTCCASYEERRQGGAQNAMGQNPTVETDIQCRVKGCAYNSQNRCEASSVCVGCCCGDVSSKSGTECQTFRNK